MKESKAALPSSPFRPLVPSHSDLWFHERDGGRSARCLSRTAARGVTGADLPNGAAASRLLPGAVRRPQGDLGKAKGSPTQQSSPEAQGVKETGSTSQVKEGPLSECCADKGCGWSIPLPAHVALPLQALPVCLTVRGACLSEGRSFLPSINCLFPAVSSVIWHYMRLAPLAANTSVKRDLTVKSSKFQGSVESHHQFTPQSCVWIK